jgi:hypothetical protein
VYHSAALFFSCHLLASLERVGKRASRSGNEHIDREGKHSGDANESRI